MDLSDLASLPNKVQEALDLLKDNCNSNINKKKIDVLINAAGVTTRSFATDSNFHLDEYVTRVNYLGPVRLIKSMLHHQHQLPTSIIQLSSIAGKIGVPVRTSYSGSKFALHGWLEAFMIEAVLQQRQLYVLGCILGSIRTDLGNHALVNVTEDGTVEMLSDRDENLGRGLDPTMVAERILAVSQAQK
jgi:short-subunit dehydrogenase